MRHLISILLENETGATSRVVGLFSQRGYNIDSITAAPTEDRSISRITIVTEADDFALERITKQLHKLVDVIKVSSLETEGAGAIEQEIVFLKVQTLSHEVRGEVSQLAAIFHAEIVDVTPELYVLQLVGTPAEIDRLIAAVGRAAEIMETVRSGVCGIARGEHCLRA